MNSIEGKTVGIAGVGHMGIGIATNLIKAGWPFSFLSHPGNQPVDDLLAMGATAIDSGAELAASCDIILLVLTGAPQVEEVMTRRDGILAGVRKGGLIVDCSTSLPETSRSMAELAASKGVDFIDAPMTRTPKEAMEGRLNLLVGGERAQFELVRPLLAFFAENITHTGPVGTGHALKLLHNYVSLGFSVVLSEAAALAAKMEVDASVFANVLDTGAGKGVVLERFKPQILDGDPSALQFSIANAQKDIGYYLQMAASAGGERVGAEGLFAVLNEQLVDGHGQDYLPRLIEFLRDRKVS